MSVLPWSKSLDDVCDSIAAPQPAPAGVAVAAMTAAMGVSLLLKVLRITKNRADLIDPAQFLLSELKLLADNDCAAVTNYMRTRDLKDAQALIDVPMQVIRAMVRGLELCAEAAPSMVGLISADVEAATKLLAGAAQAAIICVIRNIETSHDPDHTKEIDILSQRVRELSA